MTLHLPLPLPLPMTLLLILLVASFLLDAIKDILNLRHARHELPAEFQEVYDSEKYRETLEYQRTNTLFGLLRGSLWLVATVLFIALGGFQTVDTWARSVGAGEVVTGLIFVAIVSALRSFFQLPFEIYDTFVIEERFGFNKTTPATFVLDRIKGLFLGILLGVPVFAAIIIFFEKAGPWAWLYAWAALTLFQLTVAFLAPAVILPLFNRFEPLPEGELRTAIRNYADSQKFQLSGVFTMDNSKRSTRSNAFFTGFGRFRRLVLFDTLIQKHTTAELTAVVAHEIGHFKRRHILKQMALSIVTGAALFYVLGLLLGNPLLFEAFGMEQTSVYGSIVLLSILLSPLLRPLSTLTNLLSRRFEYEADSFAAETFGRPEELVSALKKLSRDNLSNLTPHPLKVWLDYTHPPVLLRILALRQRAT